MKLITPKKKGLISRRSLLIAAPAVLLARGLDAQGCGGGFCYPPVASTSPSTCMSPFYRDWSKLSPPVTVINPTTISKDFANCFEVRAENQIGGVTFGFTEEQTGANSGPTDAIGTWTSTNGIHGPWTPIGAAQTGGGSWNARGLYGPSVKEIPKGSGLFYLYYSGINGSTVSSIGFATSTTMMPGSWTAYSGNPIITGGGAGGVADPFVIDHPSGTGYIMYTATNYPGGDNIYYYTSSDGINWSFGGVALAAAMPGDPDYGIHSFDEPTVWKNKYCFWEMTYDFNDFHNSLGNGGGTIGYAISADGFTFTRDPSGVAPTQLFGGGNLRVVQQNGLLNVFTDTFPDIPACYANPYCNGGSALMTIPDVA